MKGGNYLEPAIAGAVVGCEAEIEFRLEPPELLFNTVFILDIILLNPPLFSAGTAGPILAEALMAKSS